MIDVSNWTWSFSRLNSFENGCKFCWFMRYVADKNSRPEGEANVFAEYGSFNHEIHEDLMSGKMMPWEIEDEFEKRFLAMESDFPPNKYVDLRQTYYKDGIKYWESYDGFDGYEIIDVEPQIMVEFGGIKFTGFIDLILKDKHGNYIIVDHKSKSKFNNLKEQKKYARQLYLYSIYVEEKYGKYPSQLWFNMFRKSDLVKIPFSKKALQEAKEWAVSVVEHVKMTDRFPVYPKILKNGKDENEFFRNELCEYRNFAPHVAGNEIILDGDEWFILDSNGVEIGSGKVRE